MLLSLDEDLLQIPPLKEARLVGTQERESSPVGAPQVWNDLPKGSTLPPVYRLFGGFQKPNFESGFSLPSGPLFFIVIVSMVLNFFCLFVGLDCCISILLSVILGGT